MATNREGKIIGVRFASKIFKEKAVFEAKVISWMAWLVPFFLWELLFGKMAHLLRIYKEITGLPWPGFYGAFDKLNCGIIYQGFSVVVSKVNF